MKYHITFELEFKPNPHKGLYIALEGVDGCGKSTQAKALTTYFEKHKKKVTTTYEPRVDLVGGDIIMQYFNSEISLPAEAFQYIATANRVVNQTSVIIPALEKEEVVISDRCFWSAVPYGLMDKGVDFSRKEAELMLMTQGLLSQYHQFIVPDLIFYIDISPEVALERSLKKKNRRESDVYEKKDKIEKVVAGYKWLTKEFPQEFIIINGEQSVDGVTKQILKRIAHSE